MKRFAFNRNDGQAIIVIANDPMTAWELLCESYEDDYHYIKRYFDIFTNKLAVSKGYKWLNSLIDPEFFSNFGPVYLE